MQGNLFSIKTTNRGSENERESNIHVTIGAYDGTEVCELIGIFVLSLLSKHIKKMSTIWHKTKTK